jgi:hypothetical protein
MHEQVYYILFRLFCLAALPTFQQITHRLKNRRNWPQQKEFFGLFLRQLFTADLQYTQYGLKIEGSVSPLASLVG